MWGGLSAPRLKPHITATALLDNVGQGRGAPRNEGNLDGRGQKCYADLVRGCCCHDKRADEPRTAKRESGEEWARVRSKAAALSTAASVAL